MCTIAKCTPPSTRGLKWSSVNRFPIMLYHRHTILLITRQVSARIDLSGRKRLSVKHVWTGPGCDYDNILPAVPRALKLGTRRAGQVTVVSPDIWTGVLSLPTDVAAIASENEVFQALALEAEVDSGISAFESRTNAMRIEDADRSDESLWCVSQLALRNLQELSNALRTLGSHLHSVAHPMAAQLVRSEHVSVAMVESLLDSWRDSIAMDAEGIQELASVWADCLSLTPAHPLLMMAELDSAVAKTPSAALAISLALLAAGGCAVWQQQVQKNLAMTTQSIEKFEKQQSQREATEAALKSAEASAAQLRQEILKTQANRLAAERQLQLAGATHMLHNRRWSALLDGLAEAASDGCWVQKIESSSVQTIVHGLAIDNAEANGFAGRLELALKGTGWRAIPAATSQTAKGLIEFKIVLKATLKPVDQATDSVYSSKQGLNSVPLDLAGNVQP